jgi:hypothetical protein
MLSAIKFCDELKLAGASVKAPTARSEFLDNWLTALAADDVKRCELEELWDSIKAAKSELDPQELIGAILNAWQNAKAALAQRDFNCREREIWRAKINKELKRLSSLKLSDSELATGLEDLAYHLRLNELSYSDMDGISQKDQEGSRVRRLFANRISRFFVGSCGRPLHQQTAELTEMIFPGTMVTADKVRGWRKPTTTAGRKPH